MPHAALWVVQLRKGEILVADYASFNAARGFVGGATFIMKNVMIKVLGFNAARGFVGGAASVGLMSRPRRSLFQCRTRLCGWCSVSLMIKIRELVEVSMPHAALWVVQH